MAAAAGFRPSGQNAVIVRVISYQDKCPDGVLNSPKLSRPAAFHSQTQLLLLMEALMDRDNQPQRGEEPRAFRRQEPVPGGPPPPDTAGALGTFQIRVLFRQNASWQGSLVWVEQNMEAQFRSVLELIRLMDSALSG